MIKMQVLMSLQVKSCVLVNSSPQQGAYWTVTVQRLVNTVLNFLTYRSTCVAMETRHVNRHCCQDFWGNTLEFSATCNCFLTSRHVTQAPPNLLDEPCWIFSRLFKFGVMLFY